MSGQGILARYAVVLEAIARARDGLSLTEIMRATGIPRGTVHRLLQAMLDVGYVVPRHGRKVYVLGPRLNRLLHLAASGDSVDVVVHPVVERLASRFRETAFVSRLAGDVVEPISTAVPGEPGRSHAQPGRVIPLHAAASAKAIVAFQDDVFIERAMARPRPRFTPHTRVEEAHVRADLEEVRRRGYAVCSEELEHGMVSYAVPVWLVEAGVLYSVGLVGSIAHVTSYPEAEVIGALRDAGGEIAALLTR